VGPRPRWVAVVGPTAAGKSAFGLALAEALGEDLASVDSVQIYRGLDIGSAKPDADMRARIPHHLIDLVEPDDESFTAISWAKRAAALAAERPVMFVGGAGFYLRSASWTLSSPGEDFQEDRSARQAFESAWTEREAARAGAVHDALRERDPETAAQIDPRNVVRTLRALWLCACLGEPVSVVRRRDPPRRRVELFAIVVDPGVAEVDAAIEARTDRMIAEGWLGEVENLLARGYHAGLRSMRSLGYPQLVDVVQGRSSLADARASIVTATRQYARRQRTYLRHELEATATLHVTGQAEDVVAVAQAVRAFRERRTLGDPT
jgi:tRNA dimethylallyltransferase